MISRILEASGREGLRRVFREDGAPVILLGYNQTANELTLQFTSTRDSTYVYRGVSPFLYKTLRGLLSHKNYRKAIEIIKGFDDFDRIDSRNVGEAADMERETLSKLVLRLNKWVMKVAASRSPGAPIGTQMVTSLNAVEDQLARAIKKDPSVKTGEPAVRAFLAAIDGHFTLDSLPAAGLIRKYGVSRIRELLPPGMFL